MTRSTVRAAALAACLIPLSACATRTPSTWMPGWEFVEPQPDLGPVKPAREREHQQPDLHLAVALSGGGHRAANFALGALIGLEETARPGAPGRDLLDEVDLISSVSGGGFGASAYVGSLRDFRVAGGEAADYSLALVARGAETLADPLIRRNLERGYTDGILSAPLRSLALLIDPSLNRTDAFEETVDDLVLGSAWRRDPERADDAQRQGLEEDGSLRLGDVFVPTWDERPVLVPHWIPNATVYETGGILPFAPGSLMQYLVTGYTHRLEHVTFEEGFGGPPDAEGFTPGEHAYRDWIFSLPVAVGVTASANFPGVLPPTNLSSRFDPDNPWLLLVDGGVADNLGVLSAVRLLEQQPEGERRVLVVVDAANGALGPYGRVDNTDFFTVAADLLGDTFLGTWHGRVRELLEQRCARSGIELVFLSFEDLMDPHDLAAMKELPDTLGIWLKLDDDALESVIKNSEGPLRLPGPRRPRPRDPNHPDRNLRPFELLRAIPTDFQCSNVEQRLLVAAGRLAVAKRRQLILEAVGP
jgi:hypothetical protein